EVLEGQKDHAQALISHLQWLEKEKQRLDRQISSVESTIRKLEGGEQLMAEDMFDGFDHTQYKEEVEERWGKDAYAQGDNWWRSLSDAEKRDWKQVVQELGEAWTDAANRGIDPTGDEAQ